MQNDGPAPCSAGPVLLTELVKSYYSVRKKLLKTSKTILERSKEIVNYPGMFENHRKHSWNDLKQP